MAVYLPGVVAELNTLGGTAIGTTGNLVLTVVGRGDAKAGPVRLRSVTQVPVPGGGSSSFPTPTLTAGTSVSGNTAATTIGGGTLIINLNGDGAQTITLAANSSGAAIAADIQAKVRALTPVLPTNAAAYTNFTATFTTPAYTLTSGTTGDGSSVVVSGGAEAGALELGQANGGTETAGLTPKEFYVVTAVNASGQTIQSNELSVANPGPTGAIALNWDVITGVGVTQYNVWRSTVSGAGHYATTYNNHLVAQVQGQLSNSFVDVGTTPATAAFPTQNTALNVPYNKWTQWTSMTQMQAAFGVTNELGIAAQLAQALGVSALNAVSVDFTQVDAALNPTAALVAKQAAYQTALNALLTHPTNIVVTLDPEPQITAIGQAHVNLASDPINHKMERVLFAAGGVSDTVGDSATVGSLVYNALSFNDRRVSLWAPVSPYMILLDNNGVASEQPLSGSFTALAAAMVNVLQPDEATPITNKQFTAFTRFGTNYSLADLQVLDPAGVATMTIDANGVAKIVHGITTATDTFEDSELNVVLQEDTLLQAVRNTCNFAIGQKNTAAVRLALHDRLATVLQGRISQGLMTNWSALEVNTDPTRPTYVLVTFSHTPMFGINVILVTIAFDTTGAVGA